jgi:hypothetical protein
MNLALLVTNAAEEKSATSYPLRIPLHSPQKPFFLSVSPDFFDALLIHLFFPNSKLAFEASPSCYAVLAPPSHPVLVGSILPHHGQPPFPKYLTTFITQKITSHATHAIKEHRHQITAD